MACKYYLNVDGINIEFKSEFLLNQYIKENSLYNDSKDYQFSNADSATRNKKILESQLIYANDKVKSIEKTSIVDYLHGLHGKRKGYPLIEGINKENYKKNSLAKNPDWNEGTIENIFSSWDETQYFGRWFAQVISATFNSKYANYTNNTEYMQELIDKQWAFFNKRIVDNNSKNDATNKMSSGNIDYETFKNVYIQILKYKKSIKAEKV